VIVERWLGAPGDEVLDAAIDACVERAKPKK
jgi:hypothetical protein